MIKVKLLSTLSSIMICTFVISRSVFCGLYIYLVADMTQRFVKNSKASLEEKYPCFIKYVQVSLSSGYLPLSCKFPVVRLARSSFKKRYGSLLN